LKFKLLQISIHPLRITITRNACCVLISAIWLLGSSCASNSQAMPLATVSSENIDPTQTQAPTATMLVTATQSASPTPVPPSICSPLAIQPLDKLSKIITQPFIMPRVMDDGAYADDGHQGLDLGFMNRGKQKFTGTPVLAATEGKIAAIIYNRPPYGNMIMIETPFDQIPEKIIANHSIQDGDSLYSMYAHLQNLQPLKIGQLVKCGQWLAEAGLTGWTSGPHLHFETRWGPAHAIFPVMSYYLADTTPDEMKNYTLWRMSGTFQLFNPLELLTP
jgi:murein DD-endopeptidase MepM/ murein hydrolase activator NlpD